MAKIPKRITMKLARFLVRGVADVTPWGGGRGSIEMKPFTVDDFDTELIRNGLNDNGFGVQSINGAACDVYAVYADSDGYTFEKFADTVIVGDVTEHAMDHYNQM